MNAPPVWCEGGCGRHLTDPVSVRRGYGPRCVRKLRPAQPRPAPTTRPAHATAGQLPLEDTPMYPTLFTTPGVRDFAEAVDTERQAQLAKFGDQRHPDGTGGSGALYVADRYRSVVDEALKSGSVVWRDVLLEEVYEALAESDPAQLSAELVQVAAVCAAWISDLDRRPADLTEEKPRTVGMDPVHILGIDQAADRVVAYRSNGGRLLRCLAHAPELPDRDFRPVTPEDLPDGGICTHPECGSDVLA